MRQIANVLSVEIGHMVIIVVLMELNGIVILLRVKLLITNIVLNGIQLIINVYSVFSITTTN